MRSLDAVRQALRAKTGSDFLFNMVATRVFLCSGVNLKEFKPEQNHDAAAVTKVLAALRDAGFALA